MKLFFIFNLFFFTILIPSGFSTTFPKESLSFLTTSPEEELSYLRTPPEKKVSSQDFTLFHNYLAPKTEKALKVIANIKKHRPTADYSYEINLLQCHQLIFDRFRNFSLTPTCKRFVQMKSESTRIFERLNSDFAETKNELLFKQSSIAYDALSQEATSLITELSQLYPVSTELVGSSSVLAKMLRKLEIEKKNVFGLNHADPRCENRITSLNSSIINVNEFLSKLKKQGQFLQDKLKKDVEVLYDESDEDNL